MAHTLTRPITLVFLLLTLVSGACSQAPQIVDGTATVVLDGTPFELEIVADNDSRTVGLGGRESLPENGGMLFVFPDSKIRHFIMRDCVIDIDIIFLDATGRIVAMHHMPVEEPRKPDESAYQYERRLARYPSRFNAKYAIEIRGGLLETMTLATGEVIELDTEALDAMAR